MRLKGRHLIELLRGLPDATSFYNLKEVIVTTPMSSIRDFTLHSDIYWSIMTKSDEKIWVRI